MKMAKPSERDIDAAGNLMSLLHQLDRGDYPNIDEDADVPDWFDEDNYEHLRAFYDAIKATLDKGPGYPGRVIGGMCYVIMYDKNEIVDPDSDTLDLHPKIVKALEAVDAQAEQAEAVRAAEWISVEDRVPEKYCLAAYLTSRGKFRIIRAMYVKQYEIEATGDDCYREYREEDDTEYLKSGWYECIDNWGEYSSCFVNEGEVKFWMDLPAAPSTATSNDTGALGEKGAE